MLLDHVLCICVVAPNRDPLPDKLAVSAIQTILSSNFSYASGFKRQVLPFKEEKEKTG